MSRQHLPHRRPNTSFRVTHDTQAFLITAGIDPTTGRIAEVFSAHPKTESSVAFMLQDACVLISIMLQHGLELEAIGKSLGRVPVPMGEEMGEAPASVIGAIVEALLVERDG